MITIRHTHADGTLVHGTSKGDGTASILKACRFRWFPSLKLWGIAQSRDQLAKRGRIESAANMLRAEGHDVTVEIDDTPRDAGQVKADRLERLDDRQEALAAKVARNSAEAERRFARADEIAYARNGQPRLAGHYSCKAWDADQKRIEQNMDKGCEAYGKAEHYQRAAKVVGRAEDYRERPDVIIRRIQKNEAELRRIERDIAGEGAPNNWRERYYAPERKPATGEWLAGLEAAKTFTEHQLAADRAALAALTAAGYRCHSRETIHVGDKVSTGGPWGTGEVARVNAKTVSVKNGYSWTDKVSYERIREVICPHQAGSATA